MNKLKTWKWSMVVLVLFWGMLPTLFVLGLGREKVQSPSAYVPGQISYQGYLTDSSGSPVNGSMDMTFGLYAGEVGGDPIWSETHSNVDLSEGLFTVQLGFSNTLSAEVFNNVDRYLQISFDPGDGLATLPRQKLTSAPYAMRAEIANTANSVPWDGINGLPPGLDPRNGLPKPNAISSWINGTDAAIGIGPDGLPTIAFQIDGGGLGVIKCLEETCASSTGVTSLDPNADFEVSPSLVFAPNGTLLISYFDVTGGNLKVAHCQQPDCSRNPNITTVDNHASTVGQDSAIIIGPDGLPLISYHGPGNLRVAHCTDLQCNSATIADLDAWCIGNGIPCALEDLDDGWNTSITLGAEGLPLIAHAFLDGPVGIILAKCNDAACTSAETLHYKLVGATAATTELGGTDLLVGMDGLPLVSYTVKTLEGEDGIYRLGTFQCNYKNSPSSFGTCENLQEGILVDLIIPSNQDMEGTETAITLDPLGLPLIAYFHPDGVDIYDGDLEVLHCTDPVCSDTTMISFESLEADGRHPTLTLGWDGLPIIVYDNLDTSDLEVIHCGSKYCVPYLR